MEPITDKVIYNNNSNIIIKFIININTDYTVLILYLSLLSDTLQIAVALFDASQQYILSSHEYAHLNAQREGELPDVDKVGVEIAAARPASSGVTSHAAGARAVGTHVRGHTHRIRSARRARARRRCCFGRSLSSGWGRSLSSGCRIGLSDDRETLRVEK